MNPAIKLLTSPFDNNPVGEDPRLLDDFYQLKESVDKIGDVNYQQVKDLSQKILTSVAKDLRVSAYLLFAETYLAGLPGFLQGLQVFNQLLTDFGPACHPEKPTAKLALLRWIAENRMNQTLFEKIDLASNDTQEACLQEIEKTQVLLSGLFPDAPILFAKIASQLKSMQKARSIAKPAEPLPNVVPIQQKSAANDAPAVMPDISCTNEQQAKQAISEVLDYCRRENQWLRAVLLARDFRWGNLTNLMHDNFRTAVPAPEEAIIMSLQSATINKSPHEILVLCEDIFMQAGGIYYFDLHYHASQAAKSINLPSVQLAIENSLHYLLQRFPDLLHCYFSDDKPFISESYKPWLEGLMDHAKPTVKMQQVNSEENDLDTIINQLRGKAAGKNLAEKMVLFNSQFATDGREAFQWQLALARFALESKRSDIALALLEKLDTIVEQQHLAEWEPEYALYVWQFLHQVLRLRISKLAKEMQKEVETKCDKLFSKICQLNPEKAMALAN